MAGAGGMTVVVTGTVFALRAFALFGRAGIFSETGMCFEESKADRMHTGTVSTSDLGGSGEGPLNS